MCRRTPRDRNPGVPEQWLHSTILKGQNNKVPGIYEINQMITIKSLMPRNSNVQTYIFCFLELPEVPKALPFGNFISIPSIKYIAVCQGTIVLDGLAPWLPEKYRQLVRK